MIRHAVIVALLLLAGCGGSGGTPDPAPAPASQRGDLVSVSSIQTVDAFAVNFFLTTLAGLGVDTTGLNATYGVSLNRVVYKTVTPDGRLIDASGVVAWPLKTNGARSPLLSYQHPTALQNSKVPSNSASTDETLIALAGSGFIVAMPDYIGYGASAGEIHPYVHAQGLAASVVDLLRAARRLLASNNVATNGQLFLTGYSEGGYATLAAQKEMEQNLAAEFPITASLPAAGPYHLSATAQHIVGLNPNPEPELVAFVFKAYDRWYGWNRLSEIFQPPYNAEIAAYANDGNYLQGTLTTDSTLLFDTTFRNAFLGGGGEPAVKAAFAANDIYDWVPSTPTRLFHGEDDTIVPYFNAIDALNAMTAFTPPAPVSPAACTTPLPGLRDHVNCVPDYLSEVIGWFVSLAQDL